MAKLYENKYIEMIQKKILDNELATKEDLIKYLSKIRINILQDSYLQQYFANSFIKLNEETLNLMNKFLLEYYDKRKNSDLVGGVSAFEIEDKDYIKYQDEDGKILVMDDSLEENNFKKQFQDRQNDLLSAQTESSEKNKVAILDDMKKDKKIVEFDSSLDVNHRKLTLEERVKFAAAMKISDTEVDNFLVSTEDNMYINRDTGEVYYVKINSDGQLEVRKANEVESETETEKIETIDTQELENTVSYDTPEEIDYEAMSDSDLEYIIEVRAKNLTPEQYEQIRSILESRKENNLTNEQETLYKNKVYVKKLGDFGFVSLLFLSVFASSFGIGLLWFMINKM